MWSSTGRIGTVVYLSGIGFSRHILKVGGGEGERLLNVFGVQFGIVP
jgi:hypothetical protein